MESGDDEERAAAKNENEGVESAFAYKEVRLGWKSTIRLTKVLAPDFRRKSFKNRAQYHRCLIFYLDQMLGKHVGRF